MEQQIGSIKSYKIYPLTKDLCLIFINQLVEILNHIPGANFSCDELFYQQKGRVKYHNMWSHRFIIFDNKLPIGLLTAYERRAEQTIQYPHDSIYIHRFAIDLKYQNQGIGRALLLFVLDRFKKQGFTTVSIQTNSSQDNTWVQKFYESVGFTERARKSYTNRIDIVYGMNLSS